MSKVTITVDDQIMAAVCDAALRNQGVQMLQACGSILAEVQKATVANTELEKCLHNSKRPSPTAKPASNQ